MATSDEEHAVSIAIAGPFKLKMYAILPGAILRALDNTVWTEMFREVTVPKF